MRKKWMMALMLTGILAMGSFSSAAETEVIEETGTESSVTTDTEMIEGQEEQYTWGEATDLTKEELMEKVRAASQDVNSVGIDMGMDTTLAMSMKGESTESGIQMNLNLSLDMSVESVQEPYGAHMEMTMGMDFVGQSMEQKMESYSVEENGSKVTYTQTTENGVASSWDRSEMDDEMSEAMDGLEILENGEWEQELQDYTLKDQKAVDGQGREYYVLEGNLDLSEDSEFGSQIGDLLDELQQSMGSGEISLPDEIQTDLYIYADHTLPASISMDLSGIGGEVPTDSNSATMSMEFENLVMSINFRDYNSIEAIELPEEVRGSLPSEGESGSDSESYEAEAVSYEDPSFIPTTDTSVEFTARGGSVENPAALEEMGKAYYYNVNSGNYEQVGIKLTEIVRGEEAAAKVDELLNEENSSYTFAALRNDEEYCLIHYDMYFPEDMTDSEYGVYASGCQIELVGAGGEGVHYQDSYYYPMVYDIYDLSGPVYHPGDTGSFEAVAILPKEVQNFNVQFGPYDSEHFFVQMGNHII